MPRGVYERKHPPWNKGLTKETDSRIAKQCEKQIATNLQRYGVPNVFQSAPVLEKTSEGRHSGEFARKSMDTKEKRYGDPHYNNMDKNRETKRLRYGDENYHNVEKCKATRIKNNNGVYWSEEQRKKLSNTRLIENTQSKSNDTLILKYGSLDAYYKVMCDKIYNTRKKNGTLGMYETSLEKEYYDMLCDTYGSEDVFKQYYDAERYPFKCDFYIKSEDKFIELNGFFTHGDHPFNIDDDDDVKLLSELKSKADAGDKWAKAIIYTWTDLDVRKRKIAIQNNLNIEFIYPYTK